MVKIPYIAGAIGDIRTSIDAIEKSLAVIDSIPEDQWDEETSETREGITLTFTVREFRNAMVYWKEAMKAVESGDLSFSKGDLYNSFSDKERNRLLQVLDMIMGFLRENYCLTMCMVVGKYEGSCF
jgi:hypothetical protein